MVGNVNEWVDDCKPDGTCYVRGGAWVGPPERSTCAPEHQPNATNLYEDVGFRCCHD